MSEIRYETPRRQMAAACGAAGVAAAAILTLFVLPAERGIDVTGLGGALGLTGMAAANRETQARPAPAAAETTAIPTKATIAMAAPMRSDEMTLTLPPHSGAEVKAHMAKGDHLIFRWEATGPVKADMHGERPDGGDEAATYWKEPDLASGQGAFTAPFEGVHGWYWRNRGETAVSVKVRTSGFYKDLFQPAQE